MQPGHMQLSQKMKKLKPSPTLALSARAKELQAQGKSIISLAVGEPDWPTFEVIEKAGIAAIQAHQTKYTPPAGMQDLRVEIAHFYNKNWNTKFNFQNVTVNAGAKALIFAVLQVICDPEDEVILPAPYWVSYPTMIEMSQAQPVIVNCREDTHYKMTAEMLEKNISSKTKAVILNSPSNPTGEVYNLKELKAVAAVLKKYPQVICIADDIYNRLFFEDKVMSDHILQINPELQNQMVIINGASKTFAMTGWRIGWLLAHPDIVSGVTNYLSQVTSCASEISQRATLAGLRDDHELKNVVQMLKKRRDLCAKELNKIPGLKFRMPEGAFYFWIDIRSLTQNSSHFCEELLQKEGVVLVPGEEFGVRGFVRLSYVCEESLLQSAIQKIQKFVSTTTFV